MGFLVGTMDIATANNTVAIVMANPIAKEMAEEYGITPRKTASLLDTFSCVLRDDSLWCADACRNFSSERTWRRDFSLSDHAETVLSAAFIAQLSDYDYEERV